MGNQGAHLGLDQQVLGAPLDALDALAGQAYIQVFGDRPAQAPLAHDHPTDALPLQIRGNAATGGFDFR